MSEGSIPCYDSFNELAAAQSGDIGEMSAFNKITAVSSPDGCQKMTLNQPRHSFVDGRGGVDFRTELYARDGVVPDKAKQNEYALAVENKPFYGVIPHGFTGFGKRVGEIIVFDDNGLRICNKSDVPGLGGYVELPAGWETTIEIVND